MISSISPLFALRISIIKARACGRKQIPAQGPVTDATLEQHYMASSKVAHYVPDADLRTNRRFYRCVDTKPLVMLDFSFIKCGVSISHNEHISDVRPPGPGVGRIIPQIWVLVLSLHRKFKRAVSIAFNL